LQHVLDDRTALCCHLEELQDVQNMNKPFHFTAASEGVAMKRISLQEIVEQCVPDSNVTFVCTATSKTF
jgi:hypothetical protein